MSSDLIFSVLPRQGKVAVTQDEFKVQKVSKEAALRELSDEEKELKAEEKEQRQKQQKQHSEQEEEPVSQPQSESSDDDNSDGTPPHLDIYV